MAGPIQKPAPAPLPTVPTREAWRAMTPGERLRYQVEVNTALSESAQAMGEGRPHKRTKSRAIDALGLHFKTIGRTVYLAEEMTVLYPGATPFAPDVLAVLDVEQPEDDERMAWVVADEGKGPDFVLEVLHRGDRDKDLVENVDRYARLGIPEYFVYDRLRQQIHGFRLPTADAGRYQRLVPQLGHHRSAVLGLDLAIIGNELRFLSGEATLPVTADLIARLQGMMESIEAKAERDRAAAEQAIEAAREALFFMLEVRGLPCPDEARARIDACTEVATLRRWVARARGAGSVAAIFAEGEPTG